MSGLSEPFYASKAIFSKHASVALNTMQGGSKTGIVDFTPSDVDRMRTENDVEGLKKVLEFGKSKRVRIRAVATLEEMGVRCQEFNINLAFRPRKAIECLTKALGDRDTNTRREAITALSIIGDERAVEPLISALEDKDKNVRAKAAAPLENIGDKRAVAPLIKALNDRDREVRANAAHAIGEIGGPQAVTLLAGALSSRNPEVRANAALALGYTRDPSATVPLTKALKDKNSNVRSNAEYALKQIKKKTTL